MHDSQTKEAAEETKTELPKAKARGRKTPRTKKFFVQVKHRQINPVTGLTADPEFLEFSDKASMRDTLGLPQYEGVDLRVIRGHEMTVKAKHSISVK